MKKFAVNYLLTPYLRYGKSFLFNSIIPILCGASLLLVNLCPNSIALYISIFLSIILTTIILSLIIAGSLSYEWSEMTEEQKLLYGTESYNKLTFEQTCEWTRLYGTKVTTNETNSKL